jgi:hypothetical protein
MCTPRGASGAFTRHADLANNAMASSRLVTSFQGPFREHDADHATEDDAAAATKLGEPRAAVVVRRGDDDEPHPVVDVPGGCPLCQAHPFSAAPGSFALFFTDAIPCARCFAACDPTSSPCRGHSGIHESPVDASGNVVCGTLLYQEPRIAAVIPAPLPSRWSCCGAICHHTTPACPWYRRVLPVLDAQQLSVEGRIAEYEACCDTSRPHEPATTARLEGLCFRDGSLQNDVPLLIPFRLVDQSPTGFREMGLDPDAPPPPPTVRLPGVVRATPLLPDGYQTTLVVPDDPHWRTGNRALPYSATTEPVEYPLAKVPYEGPSRPLNLARHADDMGGGLSHVFQHPNDWAALAATTNP